MPPPADRPLPAAVKLHEDKSVELLEDVFGLFVDDQGIRQPVKRYTWRNHNKIQLQVINYGARITSLTMPDINDKTADVVLGCEDLAGFIYYGPHYLGATIGRVTDVVRHGTFKLCGEQVWLTQNKDKHHFNGGLNSIDRRLWKTYVDRAKVVMSIVSPHLDNGYPGDLLIRVSFELTPMNEVKIEMEAQSTAPTLVNLSNLTYFNLAGHQTGPDELYRHVVTMNCNCYTPMDKELPTGNISNVVHTNYDFQVPVTLKKVMGITPKDGFDMNLCVNRACHQDMCFVARAHHVPSGRVLEMYSNQPGVRLTTANCFGYGNPLTMAHLVPKTVRDKPTFNDLEAKLLLFRKIHENMSDVINIDRRKNFEEMLDLLMKLHKCKSDSSIKSIISVSELMITPMQKAYLDSLLKFACDLDDKTDECVKLQNVVRELLAVAMVQEAQSEESAASLVEQSESLMQEELRAKHEKFQQYRDNFEQQMRKRVNHIPPYYRESRTIVGKGGINYKMHGGIAFQSQNYPNAVNMKNFPSCVVNPGELYKHKITYKLWLRAGNPTKWIKRNLCDK